MAHSKELIQIIRECMQSGMTNEQIAARTGLAPNQIPAVKAHINRGTYDADNGVTEPEVADAITKFGLERDLQIALRRNIAQLDPLLTVADGGKERTVPSGRIDITARDADGATVVIELKAGEADRDAVGQILSYMGDLMTEAERVRGVLVANDFTARAMSAARSARDVTLVRYEFQFTFQHVEESARQ
jgi:RecB family endonuclease NucS